MNLHQKKFALKNFIFLLSGYILLFTPLFIFDLRHNFLNSKAFYQFFFVNSSYYEKDINVWWVVFSNFLQPLLFYQNSVLITKLFYVFILFILFFLIKKEKDFNKIFFLATFFLWLIFPLFFILYGQRPSEYYFIFLYPFIYLMIIRLFTLIKKNFILVIILISFLVLESEKIKTVLKDNLLGLYYKNQVAQKMRVLTYGKKFNISFSTPLGQNYGFSYLIDWYQIKQTGNFKDPLVEIRIPPKKGDIKINETIGIKIPKQLR